VKVSADRTALADAAKKCVVQSAYSHAPATRCVRIDADEDGCVTLTATNFDLTATRHLCGEVAVPGSAIASSNLVATFLANADGATATLETSDNGVVITSGSTEVSLRTLHPDHWPRIKPVESTGAEVSVDDIAIIRRIAHAAIRDQKQAIESPYLAALHFTGHRVEATDRYRLAIGTIEANLPEMVVPLPTITKVLAGVSDEPLTVALDVEQVMFATSDATWTTRLVPHEYPQIERALPSEYPHRLTMSTNALAAAVRRVGLLDEKLSQITLRRDGGKAILSRVAVDVGEICDVVDCDGDFDETLTLDRHFFADLIDAHEDESLTLELINVVKPMRVQSGSVLLALIPVRPAVKL
jgi:DNA polymerase III sliding clamp (beta) subunit (PCNA family)